MFVGYIALRLGCMFKESFGRLLLVNYALQVKKGGDIQQYYM